MIELKNVYKYYGNFLALENINFQINKGEIVAFLGPNGAGKTTTMRIISGFLPPTYGDVFINNIDVFENQQEVKKIIGYLPENIPLYPELTVYEYLNFVAELKKVNKNEIKKNIEKVIDLCDLKERTKTLIAYLSKGLKQRLGIAQSIINQPEVLILDEPTVGLDPIQVIEIRELIKNLAKVEKRTIILSTHILSEASEICEKAIIINNGKIVAVDMIENLKNLHQLNLSIKLKLLRNIEIFIENIKNKYNNVSINFDNEYITIKTKDDIRENISKLAIELNCGLIELTKEEYTLEDVFVKLVQ